MKRLLPLTVAFAAGCSLVPLAAGFSCPIVMGVPGLGLPHNASTASVMHPYISDVIRPDAADVGMAERWLGG